MTIDLHKFCASKHHSREWLRKPWREGEWVYYSDGRIIVRERHNVDKHGGVAVLEVGGRGSGMFEKHFDRDVAFVLMPPTATPTACEECNGSGGFEHWGDCFYCYGKGEVADSINRFGLWWDGVYLHRLGQLPAVRARWIDNGNEQKPRAMELLFDGGQGLLMPRTAP